MTMQWTNEFGRTQYYMRQAEALLARAKVDLEIPTIVTMMEDLSGDLFNSEDVVPNTGYIPDDARTCLHQTSLALINVIGSLNAYGKSYEANKANKIRGEIIDWFDFN